MSDRQARVDYDPEHRTTTLELDDQLWVGPEPLGAEGAWNTALLLSESGYTVTLHGVGV